MNIIKIFFCFIFITVLGFSTSAQKFYCKDLNGIGIFDFASCTMEKYIDQSGSILGTVLGEFSITPTYGFIFTGSQKVLIYSLNDQFRSYFTPGNIVFPATVNGITQYETCKSDYKDVLYCGGWGLASYDPKSYDMRYHGDANPPRYYDAFCFYNDKIVGLAVEKDSSLWTRTICELDPENMANNRVLFRLDSSNFKNRPLEISMTSIPYSCDSTVIYLCCQVRDRITDKDETDIYILDMKQKRLNYYCHYNSYIYGLASLDEFKASRCRLSIDLDDDDNTIKGNSYLDSVRCTDEKQSIHDKDLWIYSNARIDSMRINIDQNPDGNSETLVTYGGPTNIKIVMTSPQSLELYNMNNADADAFKLAMSSIKYQNTKRNYTSGNRIIRVRIYSGTRSDSADAIIYLGPPEIAGMDSTITICPQSNNTIDLFELLNNPKTTGGLWYYNGSKHNPIYDESKDAEGAYEYVIMRGNCSPDTARVIIRKYPLVKPNLGIDQYLCPMQILRIDPKVSAMSYHWNDNSTDSFKLVSKAGIYCVTMTDSNGCMSSDTVEIFPSDFIKMNIDTNLCRGEKLLWRNQILTQDGIYMDTVPSINTCDTILSLSLKLLDRNLSYRSVSICPTSSYIYKNKIYNIGDQIIDTVSAVLACDTILSIDIKAHTIKALKITADSLICAGKATSISSNNSYSSYRWSSGDQNSSITKPVGTYTLTVTDENGCEQSSSITIKEAPAVEFTVEKTDPLCPEDLGSIRIIKTSGGIDPIRFTINGQSTSSTQIDQLTPGKYIITGIDALGCMTHDTVEIIAAQ
ncbi:MAG: hypothetical protein K1X49_12330 [Saprospiraceae bacterium]|jgi:hypothetical protein|nr:hypothetical protein [Saprospiraceae bacterium]